MSTKKETKTSLDALIIRLDAAESAENKRFSIKFDGDKQTLIEAAIHGDEEATEKLKVIFEADKSRDIEAEIEERKRIFEERKALNKEIAEAMGLKPLLLDATIADFESVGMTLSDAHKEAIQSENEMAIFDMVCNEKFLVIIKLYGLLATKKHTFSTIRQGTATNTLTKIKPDTKRNTVIDPITGTAKTTQGDFSITIPEFTELTGFKTSTYQLLDALTVALTETGAKSPAITLSLEEYMAKRGLKDKKEARKQAANDLETLFNAKISFKEKQKRGQEQDFHDIRIIDSKGIKKGIINVTFGTAFYNILLGYPIMPYPAQLWTLNGKRNPNSFHLLRKITEHKNMNIGKKNEDTISVKALLAVAPNLPTYEEVMVSGRQLDQRIIQPFERDMNALEDTLTWTYCHSKNVPLTEEELRAMSYDTFVNLLIKINWKQYPDQAVRLERKAERLERAKQAKKSTTTRKKKQDAE